MQNLDIDIWIENNVERPPKDGIYTTKDSTGVIAVTQFMNGHWQILPGKHPVKMWRMGQCDGANCCCDTILVCAVHPGSILSQS